MSLNKYYTLFFICNHCYLFVIHSPTPLHNGASITYAPMALFTYAAALVPLLPYPTDSENKVYPKVCPAGVLPLPHFRW